MILDYEQLKREFKIKQRELDRLERNKGKK